MSPTFAFQGARRLLSYEARTAWVSVESVPKLFIQSGFRFRFRFPLGKDSFRRLGCFHTLVCESVESIIARDGFIAKCESVIVVDHGGVGGVGGVGVGHRAILR